MWHYNYNELYHYGILGMRWGVRKRPKGYLNGGRRLSNKKLARLSNDELMALNERARLETQYRGMTKTKSQRAVDALKLGVAATGSVVVLYNNSQKVKDMAKIGEAYFKKKLGLGG